MILKNKHQTQQELYSKLAEALSEIRQNEKCVNAEKFLKDLMKEHPTL
jgi:hypothetical protein